MYYVSTETMDPRIRALYASAGRVYYVSTETEGGGGGGEEEGGGGRRSRLRYKKQNLTKGVRKKWRWRP